MEQNDLKIGLAFSGGGFRACSFSLGVLSLLDNLRIDDSRLLEKVIALSTVSGGTIAGARYATGIKKGEDFNQIYHALYKFMTKVDLVDLSLSRLIFHKDWSDSKINGLISAFADVYDYALFSGDKFGILLDETTQTHLKNVSFNATEFSNALPFRFQQSDDFEYKGEVISNKGKIGNNKYPIPQRLAENIRMGDILAASSCFPGGFEPINFPSDFDLPEADQNDPIFKDDKYPVGLMDGGIVDNQGIEALLLADERMKPKENTRDSTDEDFHFLDLLIISDVASPFMKDYKASQQKKKRLWRRLTPLSIFIIILGVFFASLTGLWLALKQVSMFVSIGFTILATISFVAFIITRYIILIPRKLDIPGSFRSPLRKLLRLRIVNFESLLSNRIKSVLKLVNDVFLKHIRRLNYDSIYVGKSWDERRIMNAIYELKTGEGKLQQFIDNKSIDPILIPSEVVRNLATHACKMGTTLWFTEDELKKLDMLNSIIACGQFTMCWNLLEYILKLKKKYTEQEIPNHPILAYEKQIQKYWETFKMDPKWMVKEINKKLDIC